MITNLLIALAITLIPLALLLNFGRLYDLAEQAFHALAKAIRFSRFLAETLSRACRRSSRIPYYS